ncbi:MAG: transcriptional repressor LexA [Calditrichaeota bacterium]|nr:transcriptional repressor LexA [Calditrichota bacterium]
MKDRLTEKQQNIFEFVYKYIQMNHFAPSIREIAEEFNFASPSAAQKHLRALEGKNIIKLHGTARGIEILQAPSPLSDVVPIIGSVPAGAPLLAVQNFEGWLTLRELFGEISNIFSLRVKGSSMTGVGIFDGDFVVVRHQPNIESGEIGVALVGEEGDATVKRVFFENRSVRLQPENPAFKPSVFPLDSGDIRIIGKVIGVIRKV